MGGTGLCDGEVIHVDASLKIVLVKLKNIS